VILCPDEADGLTHHVGGRSQDLMRFALRRDRADEA
jgi:hypothetical protein